MCELQNVDLQIRTMFIGAADWRWIFVLGSYFYTYIFTTYDSARGIKSMIQKRLDKLRDMILDKVTLRTKLIVDED